MSVIRLSKGTRRFIRREKARIRREFSDLARQEKLIQELYDKLQRDTNIRIASQ